MTKAAILQPTYLPYCGFFELIAQADTVVLLDTVEFSRQSWQQRNRVRLPNGQVTWLTVPVHAGKHQRLDTVRIANDRPWRRKHHGTLVAAYGRSPGHQTLSWLSDVYRQEWTLLADLNASLIRQLALQLGITTPVVRASELGTTRAGRLERLIDLCRHVEADVLLEPSGGEYLVGADLGDITVEWFTHHPHPYPQGTLEWQSHLSVIDLLAHTGNQAISHIRSRS